MALLQELDTGTPIRTGEATVTLTIDGRQVTVEKGKTVLQAAIEATSHAINIVAVEAQRKNAGQAKTSKK